jgi:hypothetical protein
MMNDIYGIKTLDCPFRAKSFLGTSSEGDALGYYGCGFQPEFVIRRLRRAVSWLQIVTN